METRPLAEVRQELSKFVDRAVSTHARVCITRNGRRAAVLLSADDFDSLMETLDVLADADLVAEIGNGLEDLESGDVASHDDVLADLVSRRSHDS